MAERGPSGGDEKADYPDVAVDLCKQLAGDPEAFGLLVCGTGQGMAMAANSVRGIRAAVCEDCFSATMARAHNDANILCLGQRVVASGSPKRCSRRSVRPSSRAVDTSAGSPSST